VPVRTQSCAEDVPANRTVSRHTNAVFAANLRMGRLHEGIVEAAERDEK
jgi:hypothetical protein